SGTAFEGVQDEPDDQGAEDGDDEGADEPLRRAHPGGGDEPATDDPTDDADDHVREAATGRPSADERPRDGAREQPDDDPAQDVHARHGPSLARAIRSRQEGEDRGDER